MAADRIPSRITACLVSKGGTDKAAVRLHYSKWNDRLLRRE